jgi:hypothetical protein
MKLTEDMFMFGMCKIIAILSVIGLTKSIILKEINNIVFFIVALIVTTLGIYVERVCNKQKQ